MSSQVFKSPLPDVQIPETALTAFVLRQAEKLGDAPAFIEGASGVALSFADLSRAIHRLAGGLQRAGLAPGGTVALMAPNMPGYAVVFHAAAVCGAKVTTVNPVYGEDEVRFQLLDAGATMVFTVAAFAATAIKAIEGTPAREVILIDRAPGFRSIADLEGSPIAQVPVDVRTTTVALPYSSGTTGLPKGVMLSHYNLVANLVQINAAVDYAAGEVALAVLPFFHIYGMQVLMNSLLAEGVTVVTMPRFDMEQALTLLEKHRVTQFFAVPPIVLGLARHPLVDRYDLSGLRRISSGAAPLGGELAQEASARIGCPVVQGYGMTELSPVSHITVRTDFKPGTSGVSVPCTLSRIVDGDGRDLGVGKEGELLVKGPQVMLGYLNNPQATAQTIDADGWLHTGDVGRIDADGHLTIVDRVKELIKVKGFQVAPAELEALIITHPLVADVAVIGVSDEEAGELPKAFVTTAPGATLSLQILQEFLSPHLASYKQVRAFEVIAQIPRSASGKILRRQLRDRPSGLESPADGGR